MALTRRQRIYCRNRAKGMNLQKAYKDAGFGKNSNEKTLKQNAFRMEKRGPHAMEIQEQIRKYEELSEKGAILKREQRQALLTEIALDEDKDTPDRLRAVDQLNRMSGDYTDKIQTEFNGRVELNYQDKLDAIQRAIDETSN